MYPTGPTSPRSTVRLPNTCPQNKRNLIHCKLLTAVSATAWCASGFEGSLFQCGARIPVADLGDNPVLLEYAGPQGTWKCGRQRDNLWILWRYAWDLRDWREIARATASDWRWALILRDPAIQALHPRLELVDPLARGREVTDEILRAIDSALSPELPAVRALVLTRLYDSVAGRIVAAA